MPVTVRVPNDPTFCQSEHSDYMRAALSNGIHIHRPDEAERFLSLGSIPEKRFGTVNNWLRAPRFRYNLKQCTIGLSTPDEWVMGQQDGVYLLVLKGHEDVGDEIEHLIVVDSGTQTIIDSCEPNSLRLQWDALQRCVVNTAYQGAI